MSKVAGSSRQGTPARLEGWRRFRALRADRRGSAAVEFGIVAFPFLTLLFAILETALVFWSTQVLETAVANASRTIYTGQFQAGNQTNPDIARAFKNELCNHVTALFPCRDSPTVHVGVQRYTPGQALEPPVTADGEINSAAFGYQATAANDIVLVRVAVEYPVFVSMIMPNQVLKNGKRLIMASASFRNEPF